MFINDEILKKIKSSYNKAIENGIDGSVAILHATSALRGLNEEKSKLFYSSTDKKNICAIIGDGKNTLEIRKAIDAAELITMGGNRGVNITKDEDIRKEAKKIAKLIIESSIKELDEEMKSIQSINLYADNQKEIFMSNIFDPENKENLANSVTGNAPKK